MLLPPSYFVQLDVNISAEIDPGNVIVPFAIVPDFEIAEILFKTLHACPKIVTATFRLCHHPPRASSV